MRIACSFIFLALLTAGCQPSVPPNQAALQVRVIAQPKAGVHEPFVHVAVYDAAPAPVEPSGAFEHVDYSSLDNIIVWLEPAGSTHKESAASNVNVKINSQAPSEHIIPVCAGAVVRFTNSSSQPISLYSVSDGNEFDLKSIAPGASGEYTVKSEGVIEVLVDPSQPPLRTLYAVNSRHVANVNAGTWIRFDDLPIGQYRINTWHPRLPGSTQNVDLAGGRNTRVTLTIGVNALPHAP